MPVPSAEQDEDRPFSNTVERRKVQFLTPTSESSQPQFPIPQPRQKHQKPHSDDDEEAEQVEVGQPQTFSVGTIKAGDYN